MIVDCGWEILSAETLGVRVRVRRYVDNNIAPL